MSTIKVPTFLNISLDFELAQTYKRYAAFILDWIIKFFLLYFVMEHLLIDFLNHEWIYYLIFVPFFLYTFLFESIFKGQTPGKIIMRIKVVSMDGNPPSVGQCAVRWMFLLADAYPFMLLGLINEIFYITWVVGPLIGILFIEKSRQRQRLGDYAAGTFVVNQKEKYYNINDTIYAYASEADNYTITFPDVIKLSDKDMTIIQTIVQKSQKKINYAMAEKVSAKIKGILNIETDMPAMVFLNTLLKDYNHMTIHGQ